MVNIHLHHFNLYKLPKSKLTNANILCLIQFGSGRNKLVQLLIRSRNRGIRTVRSLESFSSVLVPQCNAVYKNHRDTLCKHQTRATQSRTQQLRLQQRQMNCLQYVSLYISETTHVFPRDLRYLRTI